MDIALLISLAPLQEGHDIGMLTILRTQLSDTIFQKILLDLHNLALQYESIRQRCNEETRSQFRSAIR